MASSQSYSVNLNINANAGAAKQQLKDLQNQLQQISNMKIDMGTGSLTADIKKASDAAMKLSAHLATATNPQTGNLDFTKFYTSIQKSGASLQEYSQALQNMGPAGQKAFVSLADSISKSEIPLKRTSKLVDGMWNNLKKTIGWQLSSSMVHGFIGHIQKAVGYAQDLNKSLTDIRIVTGQSGDQMAKFAREANIAAKNLNTTTTQYTKASLIYYQQGLSDSEVKERAETTIKMANVTGTNAQKVSDQMTAIWNNYDNGTKSLTHYADVMTALGAATASSTDEIAQGLQKFASISNTVGLSYEYAASALATITATSRESADVTGNALKTLFSRIQGLQLGETLDDGTTLNKYSTALAKVGISIKEQSGELKSMDTILDEMGTKWDTLANDEKMALAQTVAGVRQYTQLMTLMENWDSFKQNLNIANTSQGTLDSQAAIYAESWEAASNRVRASWEGLWDTMIDSDSMVNLLDFFSGFIDILDTMAQSAGGVTGVLTSFLGIATKIFSPQLTKSVSNMAYGIGMLFGGQSRMESARLKILKDAYNSLSQDSAFGALYGAEESKIRQQAMKDQLAASINYAENKTHMTPFQQLMEQHYASQQQAHNEARIQAAARYDSAKEQASDAYWDMYDKNNRGKLFNHLDREIYDDLTAEEKAERGYLYQQQQYGDLSDREANRLKELNFRNTVDGQILKQQKALAKFSNTMNNLGTMDADKRVTAFNKAIQTFTNETGQNIDDTIVARLQEQVSSGQLTEATNGVNRLGQTIRDNLATQIANDLGVAEDNTEMRDKIRNRINSVYNREFSYLGIPGELSQEEREENQKRSKIQAGAQAAVAGAQGLLSTVSAIQALEGLQQQIAAVGDGAGNVVGILSSLASVLMSSAMGFNGLNGALTAMKVPADAAAGWAAGIMLALVAITALAKEIDKNNISEKERIKTLQQSDAELNNATESNKKLIDTYKTQNDNYNESIEKIKINMTNPDQLANDIFYANKQAMELVSEYGLKESQYSKNSMGLIEIDQKVLDSQVEAMEKANIDLQRTSALSGATTQKELAEIEIQNLLDKSGQYTPRSSGTYMSSYLKDTEEYQQAQKTRYYFGDETGNKWTFEDAVKAYGTEEWNKARDFAEANGQKKIFKDLEQQILEYQEANNLLNLAARNNVDYLLKSQEYTLDGAETFAALAYEDYKKKYNEEYENGKFSKDNLSDLDENHKNQIKKYLEAQGYTEVENIDFDGSNTSKFTFDHSGGEGSVNVEEVRKWDAEQAAASGAQETFDKSFDVLQHLTNKNAETAPGLMSLLTGDNFVNTTIEEMEKAQSAVQTMRAEILESMYIWDKDSKQYKLKEGFTGSDDDMDEFIRKNFGIDIKAFKDLFNIGDSVNLIDWFKTFENYTSEAQKLISGEPLLDQWLNGKDKAHNGFGNRIKENLNQGTLVSLYDGFKQASLLGGIDAGQAMINGITEVLEKSNLDESDWDQAVQGLLAIDWSNTLTSGGAAASVISNLGGELDTTTAAWQAFAEAMTAATGAMPDFSKIISQLTQLAGALQGLSEGSTVSADIVDQLVAMNPEFADLFSKHYSGDYTFIGNDNSVLKQAIWDQMLANKAQAGQTAEEYSSYVNGIGKNEKDNDRIGRSDFTSQYIPGIGYVVSSTHASQLGKIAGYDFQAQSNILNDYDTTKGILDLWDTGKLTDVGVARLGKNGGFDLYNKETGNWENITDTTDDRYQQISSEFKADQTSHNAAKSAMDTMLGSIHDLDEVSGKWSGEDIQTYVSSLDSAGEALSKTFTENGVEIFRDEFGVLNNDFLTALQAMPQTSERATNAVNDLVTAQQMLHNVEQDVLALQERGLMDKEAGEAAIRNAALVYNEAEAYAKLQTTIDDVAAARGLDAEMVAFYADEIESQWGEDDMANVSADELANLAADRAEQKVAIDGLNQSWASLSKTINTALDGSYEKGQALEQLGKYLDGLTNSAITAGKSWRELNDGYQKFIDNGGNMQKVLKGDMAEITKLARAMANLEDKQLNSVVAARRQEKKIGELTDTYGDLYKTVDKNLGQMSDSYDGEGFLSPTDFIGDDKAYNETKQALMDQINSLIADGTHTTQEAIDEVAALNNVDIENISATSGEAVGSAFTEGLDNSLADTAIAGGPDKGNASETQIGQGAETFVPEIIYTCTATNCDMGHYSHQVEVNQEPVAPPTTSSAPVNDIKFTGKKSTAPNAAPPGGGGGGGGGGAKAPKKVANKRKSQTVKRYKQNDHRGEHAAKAKKSEENKKDYLYGESKIAQMEKINKLAQKEANITADRIKESRKYLVEDRENLIKYMQKYGFEAEFDADGFLANYEKTWTKIYEEIAALYEDNLLTEEEGKIEEDLNIKLEELEGALEDYENSLSELADDIEKWEESMYEMFDLEIEQMEHKVEFKLELDEDSLEYIDFLIENLGDSAVRAMDRIELIADKTDYLFSSIDTAYQGIQDIYALSDSPLHLFATGGIDIDGLLTESQVESLREEASTLIDIADQLREIRDTIQEQVSEVFDMWTEKINHNLSALEQYGSVMEYFKNIVDLTGNDIFGLSTNFIRQMESAQINQSIDQMEANKAYYEQLQEMRANVEYELQKAQMSGDEERIAYWEEHLRTLDEEMQSAQDSMLSSLENTLTMISEQFTAAMEDAVEAFNESIYSSGGLEGLSADYSLLREEADLMAEDYDKIYQLSKISRNINKTLDDTKIIAGKQRLNSLLSEINDLQASGVEMSKYDLEYLEAKYQLYLAQIELENSQHDKDTVRLSKDSEGNWSYVYTTNEEKVNEAQQKYEDALYEMQNKNHEYLDEMSSSVIDLTKQMNDEISNLEISDFANLEEYNARVEEIQQKYLAQIERRENELNKAITNNQDLYDKDWKAYSEMTGYKISADKNWIDSFKETTLGYLTESESVFSDFGTRITEYAATLAESLSGAAGSYFSQIEEALGAYDTSIAGFGATITGTYKSIQDASDLTAQKTTDMATQMKDAFNEVVTTVGTWQDTDGLEITEMLDEIAAYLKEIFDAINTSANIKTDAGGPTIGQQEATRLLNDGFEYSGEHYDFGTWTFNKRGDLNISDGEFNKEGSNLVDYHAWLATQVQEALDAYYSNPEDEGLKTIAEALIKKYWAYRSVVDRVYDPGEIESNIPKSFDTGGYTGEWGSEGKLAMLHQKELILNPDDTVNFLDALNISREIINSMIEMNARASSLGLGNMTASMIKDNSQIIEQQVTITAEFPNVSDRSEIEEAFDNLINMASQYAYRSE